MAVEANPDEQLIQLYVDLSLAKSHGTEDAVGLYGVADQAVNALRIQEDDIDGILEDEWKINFADRILHAYFAKKGQRDAAQKLIESKLGAEEALNEHLASYIGQEVVIRQVGGPPAIFSRVHGRFVREARGKVTGRTALSPHERIFFNSFRWRIQTAAGSYARVIDPVSLEPLIAIERVG